MTVRKKQVEVEVVDHQPLWLRLLEKQGVAVLFAVILLGGMMKISDYHLKFLDEQTNQMKLQTRTLELIEQSTRLNSESNQRQEALMRDVSDGLNEAVDDSTRAHDEIIKELNGRP